MLLCLTQNYYT